MNRIQLTTLGILSLLLVLAPAQAQPYPPVEGQCQNGQPGIIIRDPVTGATIGCIPNEPTLPTGGATPPTMSVAATDATGRELGTEDSITFTITANPGPSGSVTVIYELSGTAAKDGANQDYDVAPTPTGSVTFPAEATTRTVTINPRTDTLAESDETVILTVIAGTGYTVGSPSSATGTIQNVAPSTVSLVVTDGNLSEGGIGGFGTTATLQVQRTAPTTGPLTVQLATTATTTNADFATAPPTSIVIPAGSTSATLTLTAADDAVKEVVETIDYRIKSDAAYLINATVNAGTITLYDNDVASVQVTATDATAAEGATPDTGSFQITRTPTTGTLSVSYEFTGASSADYTAAPTGTSMAFAAGESSKVITITPLNDGLREGTEQLVLTLAAAGTDPEAATYYQIFPTGSATIDILDRDVPVVLVVANPATITEGSAALARVQFTRSDSTTPGLQLTDALTINVTVSGTASSSDYALTNVTGTTTLQVTFPAGKRQVNVTARALDDAASEPTEILVLTIARDTNALPRWGTAGAGAATVTIQDNDGRDTDGDGILDDADNCIQVANANQANADADALGDACDPDDDNDGLTDDQEAAAGTNSLVSDTDGDGISDKQELDDGTNPLSVLSPEFRASDVKASTNGNGIQISWTAPARSTVTRYLIFMASDPTLAGTVQAEAGRTGYSFTDEKFPGGDHQYFVQAMPPGLTGDAYNATLAVTSDAAKIDVPLCQAYTLDTDKDGLCDADERARGTNPAKADTDGDGMSDFDEVAAGRNPSVAQTVAPGGVALVREGPFWIGLTLAIAILVVLVLAILQARRKQPASGTGA